MKAHVIDSGISHFTQVNQPILNTCWRITCLWKNRAIKRTSKKGLTPIHKNLFPLCLNIPYPNLHGLGLVSKVTFQRNLHWMQHRSELVPETCIVSKFHCFLVSCQTRFRAHVGNGTLNTQLEFLCLLCRILNHNCNAGALCLVIGKRLN